MLHQRLSPIPSPCSCHGGHQRACRIPHWGPSFSSLGTPSFATDSPRCPLTRSLDRNHLITDSRETRTLPMRHPTTQLKNCLDSEMRSDSHRAVPEGARAKGRVLAEAGARLTSPLLLTVPHFPPRHWHQSPVQRPCSLALASVWMSFWLVL